MVSKSWFQSKNKRFTGFDILFFDIFTSFSQIKRLPSLLETEIKYFEFEEYLSKSIGFLWPLSVKRGWTYKELAEWRTYSIENIDISGYLPLSAIAKYFSLGDTVRTEILEFWYLI